MRTAVRGLSLLLLLAPIAAAAQPERLAPVDERLLGVWRRADGGETLEITPTHCAVAEGGEVVRLDPLIGVAGGELVRSVEGARRRFRFAVEGDALTLATASSEGRYERLAERPGFFDLEPLPLGDGRQRLPPQRLQAIREALAARKERDQEVREAFKQEGGPTAEANRRMREVDRDNLEYLKKLVAEVGWIDLRRFGKEAAQAAFLIVQHGGDLRLRLTVLPEMRREMDELGSGEDYALLYDRTRLQLGRKQLYGTQVHVGADGVVFVLPLEDPPSVDLRRLDIGLPPLGKYLDALRGYYGMEREVSIRDDF